MVPTLPDLPDLTTSIGGFSGALEFVLEIARQLLAWWPVATVTAILLGMLVIWVLVSAFMRLFITRFTHNAEGIGRGLGLGVRRDDGD